LTPIDKYIDSYKHYPYGGFEEDAGFMINEGAGWYVMYKKKKKTTAPRAPG